jgi:hypothetical protein
MKLKSRLVFSAFFPILIIGAIQTSGCGFRGVRRPKFLVGDRVIATLDGTGTGTVVQVEWGGDEKYPEEPYYSIDFGLLPNGDPDITEFPGKFLKKAPLQLEHTVDFEKLAEECGSLVKEGRRTGKATWSADDVLPATVAGVSPQRVEMRETEESAVIDIQISGSYRSRGFLVVCSGEPQKFTRKKWDKCRVRKIAEKVFEYVE